MLDEVAQDGFRIGVDLGGTKTELLVLDSSGAARHRRRVPTPAHDYDAIIECIRELVREAETAIGARATVGIGTPGSLSPASGTMRNANTTCLNGRAFDRDLRDALEREVRIENDANCFALSEAVDGAARDARVVFGVIIGSGTGGGVVIDQCTWSGASSVAGEWGHNPLPWPTDDERPGAACYCGKHGCIETFLSGPGMARDHHAHTGEAVDSKRLATRARGGDTSARATLARHADRMARSLATVVNVLDPDMVVLGGGVSLIEGLAKTVEAQLPAYVFSDQVATRVVRAQHGDAGGARGAAWLWPGEGAS